MSLPTSYNELCNLNHSVYYVPPYAHQLHIPIDTLKDQQQFHYRHSVGCYCSYPHYVVFTCTLRALVAHRSWCLGVSRTMLLPTFNEVLLMPPSLFGYLRASVTHNYLDQYPQWCSIQWLSIETSFNTRSTLFHYQLMSSAPTNSVAIFRHY